MEERKTQNKEHKNNVQEKQGPSRDRPEQGTREQQRRPSTRRRRPRPDQQRSSEPRPDQQRGDQPRPDRSGPDQRRPDRQRGDQPRPDRSGADQQRPDRQGKPWSGRRQSSRRRRPGTPESRGPLKPHSDLVPVKDDEISVDRIMKRLSQRASELDLEFHGPSAKGIIDTTRPSNEGAREGNREESLAVELVKRAVGNNELLEIMASDDWNLAMDYKISSHRASFMASPLILLKRIIRRFVRLYTDFLVVRQNRLNSYLVRLCSQLVREHVLLQVESAQKTEALRGMLERQEAKFASTVAAINARFDSDEARLDLIRSELEVRADVMREELETKDILTKSRDTFRDQESAVVESTELTEEDRTVGALSFGVEADLERGSKPGSDDASLRSAMAGVEAGPMTEDGSGSKSVSADERSYGDSESVGADNQPAEKDLEL
ncbi:MAG: hypothetical protein JW759_02660 [Candidatus Coatesbacteria bacterium]|nr:hypothetical protein [Candidatus Coatesbacteria bacterium]